ncbi:anaerobic ribonucleoside-triphosphate reductase activating protein [Thiocapsa imhoffii]|uniref:Anaerobic ribonucleoside-triphosphate reductase activating protein n=1 Tax=Thiocapsa imhoffii TaxID=382777 RepID=A0A9X0WGI5_9GAMM|nr:anaerobic ribonucleoside-triphosphate reductase activating protein [Thiocapsa imhoffii]MBK1644096.1 anaerobic ribonucleoside-triphosphate reductase activating protein [Thiocapsa imhoffii]
MSPGQRPFPTNQTTQHADDPRVVRPLRVGGLLPLTTIDYPGELAAVVFCQGCGWRCRYCHNPSLLDPHAATSLTWGDVAAFLDRRVGLLDAVVFSGGEPTVQQGLEAAIAEVKARGFKVGLHTAGAVPGRLAQILPHLDWIALDIKGLPESYPTITGVTHAGRAAWESLALLLDAKIELEVRTTLMPGCTSEDVGKLARRLSRAGVKRYAIQACDTAHALDPGLEPSGIPFAQLVRDVDASSFTSLILRHP